MPMNENRRTFPMPNRRSTKPFAGSIQVDYKCVLCRKDVSMEDERYHLQHSKEHPIASREIHEVIFCKKCFEEVVGGEQFFNDMLKLKKGK